MREYLAKPNETVEQHTQRLLSLFDEFMLLYGNHFSEKEKEMIRYACKMHDEGKKNPHFQQKIREGKWQISGEYPHGVLSCAFMDKAWLKQKFGDDYLILYQAIYNHHTRDFNFSDKEIADYIKNHLKPYLLQNFSHLALDELSHTYGRLEKVKNDDENIKKYFLIKGMLNKFDYAASAIGRDGEVFEKGIEIPPINPSDNIKAYLNKKYNADLNDCQKYMRSNSHKNVIVVASTGSGKTEGSLLWAGENKTFYTLPLKVSIDAIYDRLYQNGYFERKKLGHLHSDTANFFIKKERELDNSSVFDTATLYQKRSKALIYPLTVCTVDQLFLFVFKAPGFEILPATLSYSRVIIDEIQSYSPDILAYIVYGLKLLTEMGAKFCIMTATLPLFLIKSMRELGIIEGIEDDIKYFLMDKNRHKIKILSGNDFDYDKIVQSSQSKKVLIICNTVNRAQQVYDVLKRKVEESGIKTDINLLHSRFIKGDRATKEEIIRRMGERDNRANGIAISTQIVEASLDIDFDQLYTDMCTADSLLQRLGRCYRSRPYEEEEPNVYIIDSKAGVGRNAVYDSEIYSLSLEAMKKYDGRVFSEKAKKEYMDEVYSYEKVKDTDYYESFNIRLKNIQNLAIGDFDKEEAKHKFREIINVQIIPEKFRDQIREILPPLKGCNSKEKYEAYEMLRNYSVAIDYRNFVSLKNKGLSLTPVLDTGYYMANLEYDSEVGLKYEFDKTADNIL